MTLYWLSCLLPIWNRYNNTSQGMIQNLFILSMNHSIILTFQLITCESSVASSRIPRLRFLLIKPAGLLIQLSAPPWLLRPGKGLERWHLDITALKPINQESACTLSLHIYVKDNETMNLIEEMNMHDM